jgi:hypothetical protein
MNETLEAFRKRLRGPEKEKTNWPFWIGSPTAWLALVISSTTAFFSFIYYSDQLSVVAVIDYVETPARLHVTVPTDVTFINSGSRPIAVTLINLRIVQRPDPLGPRCQRGEDSELEDSLFLIKFKPTVIKPYDAVVEDISLANGKESIDIPLKRPVPDPDPNSLVDAAICLAFMIVASDAPPSLKAVELKPGLYSSRPLYLIKRNRFSTEVGLD